MVFKGIKVPQAFNEMGHIILSMLIYLFVCGSVSPLYTLLKSTGAILFKQLPSWCHIMELFYVTLHLNAAWLYVRRKNSLLDRHILREPIISSSTRLYPRDNTGAWFYNGVVKYHDVSRYWFGFNLFRISLPDIAKKN